MKNKSNLVTGETYTLSELFSGERRIIIPDLQRDYCWGCVETPARNEESDLVLGFVKELVKYSKKISDAIINI